jgi:hypothetical protein
MNLSTSAQAQEKCRKSSKAEGVSIDGGDVPCPEGKERLLNEAMISSTVHDQRTEETIQ